MNKEVVSYEQSIELKDIGFDEKCYGFYTTRGFYVNNFTELDTTNTYPAPLKQQVFRWFRDKYNIHVRFEPHTYLDDDGKLIIEDYEWEMICPKYYDGPYHDTFEESENDCINTIIELIKTNKYDTERTGD